MKEVEVQNQKAVVDLQKGHRRAINQRRVQNHLNREVNDLQKGRAAARRNSKN